MNDRITSKAKKLYCQYNALHRLPGIINVLIYNGAAGSAASETSAVQGHGLWTQSKPQKLAAKGSLF